jgi:crotonobetainyl-CoA:carnitine CoA-transferase CaiB-like acyl-CoA transferase
MGASLRSPPRWTAGTWRKCLLSIRTKSLSPLSSYANRRKVNRNKKSIGISFKEEKGADLIRKLALNADVFVENYLPGTLKKYGLDFKALSKVNPKLIYASVTGYGQFGPYSNRAGYDVMVEAWVFFFQLLGYKVNETVGKWD